MFWTRLASGIVLVVVALIVLISGGPILAGTLFVISLIGLHEWYRALGLEMNKKILSPLNVCGYFGTAVYYLLLFLELQAYTMTVLIGVLILMMSVYVFAYPRYRTEEITGAFFGVVYVSVMLSCIYELRLIEDGVFLVWLIFISSWGCDTCAYCIGMLFGKHKMSPKLSPKKSVEGAVGGVAGAVLIGVLYGLAVGSRIKAEEGHLLPFAIICGAGALISMIGDLAASAVKRNHEIKDYGNLIPGHGGILDRFDSVIFIAPVIYYLAVILM